MPTYRSFYQNVEPALVINADPKRFPLRSDKHTAAEDARRFWHTQGEVIVPYRIQGEAVTELTVRTRTVLEVVG